MKTNEVIERIEERGKGQHEKLNAALALQKLSDSELQNALFNLEVDSGPNSDAVLLYRNAVRFLGEDPPQFTLTLLTSMLSLYVESEEEKGRIVHAEADAIRRVCDFLHVAYNLLPREVQFYSLLVSR